MHNYMFGKRELNVQVSVNQPSLLEKTIDSVRKTRDLDSSEIENIAKKGDSSKESHITSMTMITLSLHLSQWETESSDLNTTVIETLREITTLNSGVPENLRTDLSRQGNSLDLEETRKLRKTTIVLLILLLEMCMTNYLELMISLKELL